jgi:hypothetical protein
VRLRRRRSPGTSTPPTTRCTKRKKWFVYAKPPFAGPEAVLAYLARYTHRVAISNSRLGALDERGVTFRYKDYRRNGRARYRTMTLSADQEASDASNGDALVFFLFDLLHLDWTYKYPGIAEAVSLLPGELCGVRPDGSRLPGA